LIEIFAVMIYSVVQGSDQGRMNAPAVLYRYQFKDALAAILSIVLIGVQPTLRVRQNFAEPQP
jgi:hypothetical protein